MRGDAAAEDEPVADGYDGAVRLMRCPVGLPASHYAASAGLVKNEDVSLRAEQFGPNVLSVKTPRFVDLYIEQLLSPLVIFQMFCSVLWLLDAVSYGFTAFQVFTILLLESTSVMQRQRTFKTLNSMSAKPFGVFVFRTKAWQRASTAGLLRLVASDGWLMDRPGSVSPRSTCFQETSSRSSRLASRARPRRRPASPPPAPRRLRRASRSTTWCRATACCCAALRWSTRRR